MLQCQQNNYDVSFWQPKLSNSNSNGVFIFWWTIPLKILTCYTQSGKNDEGVANLVCMKFFHFRELQKKKKRKITALFLAKESLGWNTALVQLNKIKT